MYTYQWKYIFDKRKSWYIFYFTIIAILSMMFLIAPFIKKAIAIER